jgi:hypothetical protein
MRGPMRFYPYKRRRYLFKLRRKRHYRRRCGHEYRHDGILPEL